MSNVICEHGRKYWKCVHCKADAVLEAAPPSKVGALLDSVKNGQPFKVELPPEPINRPYHDLREILTSRGINVPRAGFTRFVRSLLATKVKNTTGWAFSRCYLEKPQCGDYAQVRFEWVKDGQHMGAFWTIGSLTDLVNTVEPSDNFYRAIAIFRDVVFTHGMGLSFDEAREYVEELRSEIGLLGDPTEWEFLSCVVRDPNYVVLKWVRESRIQSYTWRIDPLMNRLKNRARADKVVDDLVRESVGERNLPLRISKIDTPKGSMVVTDFESFERDILKQLGIPLRSTVSGRIPIASSNISEVDRPFTKISQLKVPRNSQVTIDEPCELIIGGVHYQVRFEGKKGHIIPC